MKEGKDDHKIQFCHCCCLRTQREVEDRSVLCLH
uniref:Uncharacterized protein n=1 Tax=Lotus japonicus TaxID=34305 RepID=I3RZX3_LOTJA|nr:unknown [Lotus japonicus]